MALLVSSTDDDRPGRPERLRELRLRMAAPENEIPGSLALDRVLGRSADVAVVLVSGRVHSCGIALEVAVSARHSAADDEGDRLLEQAFADRTTAASGTALLLGVEFSDGRTAINLRLGRFTLGTAENEPERVHLQAQGGGGGYRSVDLPFWLSPLPPAGDLLIVCAWPHRGIAETRTVITAAELADAHAKVTELWPWQAKPTPPARPEPGPPVVPEGWFAEALRRGADT